MGKKFSCQKISEGVAEGEALVSSDEIMFYLIDPKTGVVIEPAHALEGQSMAGKILIFPWEEKEAVWYRRTVCSS